MPPRLFYPRALLSTLLYISIIHPSLAKPVASSTSSTPSPTNTTLTAPSFTPTGTPFCLQLASSNTKYDNQYMIIDNIGLFYIQHPDEPHPYDPVQLYR